MQPVFSGKKFQKIQERLKKANAEFKKLSRKEQRIQIAKDVIAQLKREEIVAKSSYFQYAEDVELTSIENAVNNGVIEEPDLSEVACQVQCEVCGIGSLFLTAVKRNDKVKFTDDSSDRDYQVEYLREWFSEEQFDFVEGYFERGFANTGAKVPWNHSITLKRDRNKRLIMIMENIISNEGRFDPSKGKHGDAKAVEAFENSEELND